MERVVHSLVRRLSFDDPKRSNDDSIVIWGYDHKASSYDIQRKNGKMRHLSGIAKALQHLFHDLKIMINLTAILENKLVPLEIIISSDHLIYCERISTDEAISSKEVASAKGMVEKFVSINSTLHYRQGKNDTFYYAYDIFSSFSYHKKLSTKSCRALIFNGDHDLTFPYVGVEQWISSLNLEVEAPWKPFYLDSQVGG
ncbi:hypothetical protein E3N88_00923 [Mikania micrantha]|uniref:Uncharacterized protein n=1 Tax=Mikania micrantha TaxID=192012 RepID=A0A5N6Q0X9_9ASTR|nr:hypothetical protein E3N88_00923 [Mikania micrantha]